MWKHSESLTEKAVHEVENAMMNNIGEDPLTDASVRMTARDRSRLTSAHDEPTTPEMYGAFADISEPRAICSRKQAMGGWWKCRITATEYPATKRRMT
jgi:hypothetical protein